MTPVFEPSDSLRASLGGRLAPRLRGRLGDRLGGRLWYRLGERVWACFGDASGIGSGFATIGYQIDPRV